MPLPTLVQALRRQLRQRLKVDIVRARTTAPLNFHLEEVLKAYRIDTIIDVGANEGQFGSLIRELGFQGQIHSFEPVKRTYERLLSASAHDDRWTAHNVALGREPGNLTMNVSEGSVFSSILNPNEFGSRTFEDIKVEHREEVEVSTLDRFVERHIGRRDTRLFLKMDTQGYDLQVFEGATASLESICCILSELSLIPIYDGMTDYLEALSVYRARGFSVSGLYPVNRNDDLSLIEVDCMLVNRTRR